MLLGPAPAPALAISRATEKGKRASPGNVSSDAPLMLSPALEGSWWIIWFVTVGSQSGLGWKGPSKTIQSNPCYGQGHLPLDQVAQSPVQPDLEHFQ